MLSLTFENKRVSLFCNDRKLLDGISLTVNRHDCGNIVLEPDRIVDQKIRFVQPGVKAPIEAFLGLEEGDVSVLTISCRLVHDHVRAPRCFEGTDSFTLRFDSFQADAMMANYECSAWWTRPAFPQSTGELPDRTISTLIKSGETYVHLYPMCDDVYSTRLKGEGETTALIGSIRCMGYDKVDGVLMAIGVGQNPYQTVHDTMAKGFASVKQPIPMKEGRQDIDALDLLGWCTYDAFYREVTHKKILEKLKELKDKNVPVKMLLIDSGWFTHDGDGTHGQRASDLRANPEKFPKGLKGLIEEVKRDYGIEKVGIWHGMPAIWQGIEKGSYAYEQTKDNLVELPSGYCFPGYTREQAFGFYNYWHQYLKDEGIDFIKVDIQGMNKMVAENLLSVNEAMKNLHAGFEASAALHFGGDVINCMGMNQENVQSRPLSGVARNSDDFFPKKENGFAEHFLQNAYNAVYHGQIYFCDYDMWWTDHISAHENAVLRAVSGGPVYVSDPVGATKPDELVRLCDANGRLYRCDGNGTVCADNLFCDPTKDATLAKMYNRAGKAGLVAAFNLFREDKPVTGGVKASDVEGLEGDTFLCYLQDRKEYAVVGRDEAVSVTLSRNQAELAIFVPIENGFAPLGLKEKYVSPATIWDTDASSLLLREGGIFAFYCEKENPTVYADGEKVAVNQVADRIFEAVIPESDEPAISVVVG